MSLIRAWAYRISLAAGVSPISPGMNLFASSESDLKNRWRPVSRKQNPPIQPAKSNPSASIQSFKPPIGKSETAWEIGQDLAGIVCLNFKPFKSRSANSTNATKISTLGTEGGKKIVRTSLRKPVTLQPRAVRLMGTLNKHSVILVPRLARVKLMVRGLRKLQDGRRRRRTSIPRASM
jgi:hypothetical protein